MAWEESSTRSSSRLISVRRSPSWNPIAACIPEVSIYCYVTLTLILYIPSLSRSMKGFLREVVRVVYSTVPPACNKTWPSFLPKAKAMFLLSSKERPSTCIPSLRLSRMKSASFFETAFILYQFTHHSIISHYLCTVSYTHLTLPTNREV
eukprot:TRINITY_DN7184_c0_g4_i1.p1 TRINITY_DN7184_c0_g4~~TRINITY_DN7184_c0_g4_i1.p1  ORF type:complete len:150 (+),score=0.32 TRINITY_DN7184_c0_g4_i1:131-580(+)